MVADLLKFVVSEGNFWVRRFRDAWDSCSHKKAVALGIFSLVWNMSSVVARVWAGNFNYTHPNNNKARISTNFCWGNRLGELYIVVTTFKSLNLILMMV